MDSRRTAAEDSALQTTAACKGLILLGAEGASAGLFAWSLRAQDKLPDYVGGNFLNPVGRRFIFINMMAGAALAIAAGLVPVLRALKRRTNVDVTSGIDFGIDGLKTMGEIGAPLVLIGLLPLLSSWQLWVGRELTMLALLAVFVVSLRPLVLMSLTAKARLGSTIGATVQRFVGGRVAKLVSSRRAPLFVVIGGVLFYAGYFSFFTIRNHFNLGTAAFDLGIEHNLVWNAVHGGPLFKSSPLGGPHTNHLGYHQTYFAYVIGLFYFIAPRPETFLIVQAVLMGAAALPLFFLGQRYTNSWTSCLVAILYLLYPPLHGANLYDVHYLPLATFFLWTTLLLVEQRRDGWAVLLVVLTLSVREDISALLAVIGVYLVATGRRPRAGLVLAAVGAVYFVALKMIIMPRFIGGHSSYVHQYAALSPEGDGSFGGILKTVFANPGFTLTSLLERDKLFYFLQIALPLAFFPWRRPIGLLCSVPGFFFTLLSTHYPPLVQISFQYTTYWTAFLFLAVLANLSEWEAGSQTPAARRTRTSWLITLAAATMIASFQYGAILQRNTARGGFGPFRFTRTENDRARSLDLESLIALVPPRAKVVGSELIVPHIASRPDAYTLRVSLADAEYLLFSTPPWGDERPFVLQALQNPGLFGVVQQRGEFVLARRGYSTAGNRRVLSEMGADPGPSSTAAAPSTPGKSQ